MCSSPLWYTFQWTGRSSVREAAVLRLQWGRRTACWLLPCDEARCGDGNSLFDDAANAIGVARADRSPGPQSLEFLTESSELFKLRLDRGQFPAKQGHNVTTRLRPGITQDEDVPDIRE